MSAGAVGASNTSSIMSKDCQNLFSKHRVNLYTALAVGGLALGLIALGVIVAAMGTSPKWYHEGRVGGHYENGVLITSGASNTIPWEVNHGPGMHITTFAGRNYRHILQEAFSYGAKVGAVALGPCIAGFVVFILAMIARNRIKNKSKEKQAETAAQAPDINHVVLESTSKKWRNIAVVLGFSIAVFSTGLVIGSGDILHHGVSKMNELIQIGRLQAPDVQSYSGHNFWDEIQSNWLNPTEHAMKGILPVGIFGALGGSGVVVAALLGKGIFSCMTHLKSKITEKKEMNSKGEQL